MPEEKRPMGPEQYLLLRGWERHVYEDIAQEYRRMREANDPEWPLLDNGVRFRRRPDGTECSLIYALGHQLVQEAKAVGGFDQLVKVVEDNRVERPSPGRRSDLN